MTEDTRYTGETVSGEEQWQAALEAARNIGEDHGRNAASWVELDEDTAARIDEDGVYWVLDGVSTPLSGEWADDYGLHGLSNDLALDQDDDGFGDAVAAYEDGFYEAFEAEVERQVERLRGPTLDLDEDTAYAVDGWGWGIAWRYVGQTFGGKARMVMVGDDRVFEVDADDVRELPEDDYCHECGQVGCTADRRVTDEERAEALALARSMEEDQS